MKAVGQILRDLGHAWRSLRRSPAVSAIVVASIGLGVGVNTTVFSWIDAVALNPAPGVKDISALRLVEPRTDNGGYPGVSWLEYRDLVDRLPGFETLAAYRMTPLDVGLADRSDRSFGLLVSGNYFAALGLRAEQGRLFVPGEGVRPGADPIVVVSDRFWRTKLGASPSVLGRPLRINDRPLTVVGVAPAGFEGTVVGLAFDLWIPATAAPLVFDRTVELDARADREYSAFGRLRPGQRDASAEADLARVMRDLAREFPSTNRTVAGVLLPFWRAPRGPQQFMVGALGVLQAVMLLVLVAVCGNTANLVLARATSRRHEIGIRRAVGASRWHIVSLLLAESLLLASAGTVVGLALAVWGTDALRAVPMPTAFPIRFETAIDATSAAFAAGLGLLSALLFGLAPALQLSRTDAYTVLTHGTSARGQRGRLLPIFMAVEIGLAVVILALAGIFLERFEATTRTDPGFRREGVLLEAYDLRERNRRVDQESALRFARDVLTRLRTMPGVASAAIAASIPLDIHGLPIRDFELDGHVRADGLADQALTNLVTPGYFATMGIPIRDGTDFADLGDESAPPQAVVNETFVHRFTPGRPVLGRRLTSGGRTYTIVGVVKDSSYDAFGEPPTPFIYVSYRDGASAAGEIHARASRGSGTDLAEGVRQAAAGADASATLYNARTLTENVDQNLVFQRIPARLFAVVGPLLVALAAIGIFAVVAYGVADRRREIGVRVALGATTRVVTRELIIDTMQIVAFGAAAGWAVAFVLDRDVVQSPGFDVTRLVVMPVGLLAVATVAAWIPAARAARTPPMAALLDRERPSA